MPSQRGSTSLVRWGQERSSVGGGCRLDVLALAGVRRLWVLTLAPGLCAGLVPSCQLAEPEVSGRS